VTVRRQRPRFARKARPGARSLPFLDRREARERIGERLSEYARSGLSGIRAGPKVGRRAGRKVTPLPSGGADGPVAVELEQVVGRGD